VRFVPDATTEMTELLAGRADWIWNLNPDQFDNVNKLPMLTAVRKESMRVGYMSLDAAGRTGADNPLTKLKVRQAIWHAIDRQTIADKLVTGGSRVPPAPCFPPQFGCDAEASVLYDYNPAKAKQLLTEAGYPDGVEFELASYVLPQWGAAVQNYLQAVGIRAKLNQLQVAALIQRAKGGELRAYLGSWGSYSINDVSAILPNFFDGGADDYARDPDVIKWLMEGGSSNDADVRRKAYSSAVQRITERAYWMPLFTTVTTYAHSRQLDFSPYPDELPRCINWSGGPSSTMRPPCSTTMRSNVRTVERRCAIAITVRPRTRRASASRMASSDSLSSADVASSSSSSGAFFRKARAIAIRW